MVYGSVRYIDRNTYRSIYVSECVCIYMYRYRYTCRCRRIVVAHLLLVPGLPWRRNAGDRRRGAARTGLASGSVLGRSVPEKAMRPAASSLRTTTVGWIWQHAWAKGR